MIDRNELFKKYFMHTHNGDSIINKDLFNKYFLDITEVNKKINKDLENLSSEIKTYNKEDLISKVKLLPKRKLLTLEGEIDVIDYEQLITLINQI